MATWKFDITDNKGKSRKRLVKFRKHIYGKIRFFYKLQGFCVKSPKNRAIIIVIKKL